MIEFWAAQVLSDYVPFAGGVPHGFWQFGCDVIVVGGFQDFELVPGCLIDVLIPV